MTYFDNFLSQTPNNEAISWYECQYGQTNCHLWESLSQRIFSRANFVFPENMPLDLPKAELFTLIAFGGPLEIAETNQPDTFRLWIADFDSYLDVLAASFTNILLERVIIALYKAAQADSLQELMEGWIERIHAFNFQKVVAQEEVHSLIGSDLERASQALGISPAAIPAIIHDRNQRISDLQARNLQCFLEKAQALINEPNKFNTDLLEDILKAISTGGRNLESLANRNIINQINLN